MPIQSTNIDAATGDAIDTQTLGEVLTVATDVIVQSDEANGIGSADGKATIVNDGQIIASDTGIYSDGSGSSTIDNETGGSIVGVYGIFLRESNDIVVNAGTVTGSYEGIFDYTGNDHIQNTGDIFGASLGVGEGFGDNLYNAGTITSESVGLFLGTDSGSSTSADNRGSIQGSSHSIASKGAGSITLSNEGDIEGNIDFQNTGGATLTNSGSIRGFVRLGNGTNIFDGRGGTMTGEIFGGSKSDTMRAGSDGETMNGGLGHDSLYGGPGADTFVFTSSGTANWDHVYGLDVKNDMIELDHSDFAMLKAGAAPVFSIAASATSATDHLFYSSGGGGLWYDPDGSGKEKAVEIATLGAGLKLTASNFEVV